MVSYWGQPPTCYLAIKLETFTKCPVGQIVKYKLNKKEDLCSRKYPTDLTEEIKQSNSKMVSHWRQPPTCYLAIKLETFTKCPVGQIVKCKLNKKEDLCSRKQPTHLTEEIKQSNSKMVSYWEQPPTCYLAINLEKFNKRPAGQIVKCKLNKKKDLCSRKYPTDLTEEIKYSNSKMVSNCG